MKEKKILVVDDEENIVELVKFNLEKEGYQVFVTYDGQAALDKLQEEDIDLLVLDLMLPEIGGLDICRQIRNDDELSDLPIIMLTAKEKEVDRILGLELGADDYVTKPFSPRELVARVKAILRRTGSSGQKTDEDCIKLGEIVIDLNKYEVLLDDKQVNFTPKEFELLMLLAKNAGKVLTRNFLLKEIWGYGYNGDTRTVDVHIRRTRQKLNNNLAEDVEYIETVRGVGYRFKELE
ncbi:response regulator transcription factor [Acetohalobium arabaticum]|uniref:Stage 0 sporulation protein A homolog n=1 Tax=Acetohalobium arabaticum (strain ATCC 49924 / DSM 5501 / Z-7288) TaxID=574087 RepID=D9QVY0_ACEAZ|nr:response regulator transcription factor [Acetohalobium arabaticum]ADL12389.1 two component transcriptional regulator, winged helix family [Acetohalobium arabaticum DSM 5501]